jgi:hypothetical protein
MSWDWTCRFPALTEPAEGSAPARVEFPLEAVFVPVPLVKRPRTRGVPLAAELTEILRLRAGAFGG